MNVTLALAETGWRVFASMRDLTKGETLRRLAEEASVGDRVSLLELDVTDVSSISRAVASALEKAGGTLDALLANAGYSALGAFEDMSDADCGRQMETNFFGTLAVTRAVLPIMRSARHGRIVVVSSNAVNTPHPMLSMYAASKWALEGWAEALAMELAPFGVTVRVVQPGAHRTPFATHVVPVIPEGSAYKPWLDAAMPGFGDLDRWGRDPAKATAPIVRAIAEEAVPFRTLVGEDTEAFAALKGLFPYEVRAWATRAIVGLPAAGVFANITTAVGSDDVLQQVVGRIGNAAARDRVELAMLAAKLLSAKEG